jgi:hypothetical protein
MARLFLNLRVAKGPSRIVWTPDVANAYGFVSVTDAADMARKLGPAVDNESTHIAAIGGKFYIVKN